LTMTAPTCLLMQVDLVETSLAMLMKYSSLLGLDIVGVYETGYKA